MNRARLRSALRAMPRTRHPFRGSPVPLCAPINVCDGDSAARLGDEFVLARTRDGFCLSAAACAGLARSDRRHARQLPPIPEVVEAVSSGELACPDHADGRRVERQPLGRWGTAGAVAAARAPGECLGEEGLAPYASGGTPPGCQPANRWPRCVPNSPIGADCGHPGDEIQRLFGNAVLDRQRRVAD
jgi:hypothetical protein